jgi:hypothetical protein
MGAKQAAHDIARAIMKRKDEVIISLHGKIAVFLRRNFPWLVSAVLARERRKQDQNNRFLQFKRTG